MHDIRDDHKHSDVDTEPDDIAETPDTSLLPDSYKSWPHLFTYVPRKARELWIQACSQLLGELHTAYNQHDVSPQVDQHIHSFLQLPRMLLRRAAGQAHADKKLARTLFTYLQSHHPPRPASDPSDAKDLRDDASRRVSAATRKVKQGHVRKAVDALIQPGMLEITVETIEQLQALHPDASAPLSRDDIEFAAQQAKHWLSAGDVAKRRERFYDNGSAPGPSGWTGAMLRPLLENIV
jgi:hypothetical protein